MDTGRAAVPFTETIWGVGSILSRNLDSVNLNDQALRRQVSLHLSNNFFGGRGQVGQCLVSDGKEIGRRSVTSTAPLRLLFCLSFFLFAHFEQDSQGRYLPARDREVIRL